MTFRKIVAQNSKKQFVRENPGFSTVYISLFDLLTANQGVVLSVRWQITFLYLVCEEVTKFYIQFYDKKLSLDRKHGG